MTPADMLVSAIGIVLLKAITAGLIFGAVIWGWQAWKDG